MTFDAVAELGALLYRVYGEHGKWGRRHRAILKRRRVAARLAEVQRRTVYRSIDFICGGCGDFHEEPMYSHWECECGWSGVAAPEIVLAVLR